MRFKLAELFKKNSVVGVVGNRSSAKTSLVLVELYFLKKEYPNVHIAVMGVNEELYPELEKLGITILQSKMDVLDLRLKDHIIYVDEMAMFFDTQSRSKQLDKLMRFFDRIEHQNCKFIFGTAREGYFNKFICSRVNAFLVKQIEYDALTNGTWLKERVKAITSKSDYRLEADKSEFYIIATDTITQKKSFSYMPIFDTKKTNKNLFEKGDKNYGKNYGEKDGK